MSDPLAGLPPPLAPNLRGRAVFQGYRAGPSKSIGPMGLGQSTAKSAATSSTRLMI